MLPAGPLVAGLAAPACPGQESWEQLQPKGLTCLDLAKAAAASDMQDGLSLTDAVEKVFLAGEPNFQHRRCMPRAPM